MYAFMHVCVYAYRFLFMYENNVTFNVSTQLCVIAYRARHNLCGYALLFGDRSTHLSAWAYPCMHAAIQPASKSVGPKNKSCSCHHYGWEVAVIESDFIGRNFESVAYTLHLSDTIRFDCCHRMLACLIPKSDE